MPKYSPLSCQTHLLTKFSNQAQEVNFFCQSVIVMIMDASTTSSSENPGQEVSFRRRYPSHQLSGASRTKRTVSSESFPDSISTKDTSGDASSSSSVDEDDKDIRRRIHRRKRRKGRSTDSSKIDPDRMKLIEKVVQIEMALLSRKSGALKLKELATSEAGLITDDLRRKVWPKLLNLDVIETEVLPSQEEIESHKFYNQVVLDVDRSLKRFPPGIDEEERPRLQDQLTKLILHVLARHPELHYYQGYHDVAITFLLVVGEQLGFHIVDKLSVGPWLRDFMLPTMEKTNYLLQFIYPILRREDEDLFDFMERSEVGTIFALPWLITWFGHVLPNYCDVVRLYDFFLAQPPLMPVYLAAAIVLYKKDSVMNDDCDMATTHAHLSRIPVDAPFEKLLKTSLKLYASYPPNELEEEVSRRVQREKTLHEFRRRQAQKRFERKETRISAAAASKRFGWTVSKVLLVAAPVVIGVFVWKFFDNSSI